MFFERTRLDFHSFQGQDSARPAIWLARMNVSICRECAAPADAGLIFCKNCGATLQPPVPLTQSHEQKPVSDVPQVASSSNRFFFRGFDPWVSRPSLIFGRQPISTPTYAYVCVNPTCPRVTELQEHDFSPTDWTARGEVGPVTCSCCGQPVEFMPDAQYLWPSVAVGLLCAVIAGGVVDAITSRGVGVITGMSVGSAVGAGVQRVLAKRAARKFTKVQAKRGSQPSSDSARRD